MGSAGGDGSCRENVSLLIGGSEMIGLRVNDQLNSDDGNALARIKYSVILKRE